MDNNHNVENVHKTHTNIRAVEIETAVVLLCSGYRLI